MRETEPWTKLCSILCTKDFLSFKQYMLIHSQSCNQINDDIVEKNVKVSVEGFNKKIQHQNLFYGIIISLLLCLNKSCHINITHTQIQWSKCYYFVWKYSKFGLLLNPVLQMPWYMDVFREEKINHHRRPEINNKSLNKCINKEQEVRVEAHPE